MKNENDFIHFINQKKGADILKVISLLYLPDAHI